MKPRTDIAHMGTIGRKGRVDMTFDQNSLAHLMAVLTDLYSDPELAVIREYSTNAADSHIDAGNPDPIEIELPTSLRRVFVVRDYGLGMSETDVTENFSKYGYSSKRETDEQVGMLGLGCKSALTYSSQFTFIATKDNEQVTVLVTRNEDGAGALQLIDKKTVNSRNGVEVQIPVKGQIDSFNSKANEFFQYWNPGAVKINGKLAPSIWDPAVQKQRNITVLDDDLLLLPNAVARGYGNGAIYNPRTGRHEYPGKHKIVMGNVPYPHADPLSDMLTGSIVARVPVGSINFTPSREQLQDTALTRETLNDIKGHVHMMTERSAKDEVAKATTAFEALQIQNRWAGITNGKLDSFQWRSAPIPKTLKNDTEKTMEWTTGWYRDNGLDISTRAQRFERSISTKNIDKHTLCVTGHKAKSIAKGTKERVIAHIEALKQQSNDPDFKITRCYLSDGDPYGEWCLHKISLEDLKKYAITKTTRTNSAGTFRTVGAGGMENKVTELSDSDVKVMIPAGGGNLVREVVGNMVHKKPGYVAVIVASNRTESFQKKQKNVLTVKEFAEQELKSFNASLTPLETWYVTATATNYYREMVTVPPEVSAIATSFRSIGDAEVDDPDVKKAKAVVNTVDAQNLQGRVSTLIRLLTSIGIPIADDTFRKKDKAAESTLKLCSDVKKRYPLLKYNLPADEAIQYVNQVYFCTQNKTSK